jgi:putative solute:sodium symporter small subunit
MSFESKDTAKKYWDENIKLVISLLSIWAFVSFGCGILFVDYLNEIQFMGFKLGFWFAQQGAIYVFLVLIAVYVHKANKLDEKYGVDE